MVLVVKNHLKGRFLFSFILTENVFGQKKFGTEKKGDTKTWLTRQQGCWVPRADKIRQMGDLVLRSV